MRAIAPRTGAPERTYAEDQLEYKPITVGVYEYADGPIGVLTRWQPSAEERAAIAAGEDLYVMQLTSDGRMPPIIVRAGPGDFAL